MKSKNLPESKTFSREYVFNKAVEIKTFPEICDYCGAPFFKLLIYLPVIKTHDSDYLYVCESCSNKILK